MNKSNDLSLVFVSSNLLSEHSADGIYLMEMCNSFANNRVNVKLCVPNYNLEIDSIFAYYNIDKKFKIIGISMPRFIYNKMIPGRSFLYALFSIRQLLKLRDHRLFIRNPWVFFLFCFIIGNKEMFEAHQIRFNGKLQTFLFQWMVKLSISKSGSTLVCISDNLRQQWEKIGVPSSRIVVAHDAVNVSKFITGLTREDSRASLGLDQAVEIITYTGSLQPGKGVETFIQCSKILPEKIFLIVGGKESQINDLKKGIAAENVLWVGQVSPDKVPYYQSASDVLVLPNNKGSVIDDVTSPMKLFEYMASGRPIVATDMPSVLEVLEHKRNALICPAGDPLALAENIKLVLEDSQLGKDIAANALKELEHFTWDFRAKKLLSML
jgi:glycosyltransferase involved in cell wall biosynthesis